MDYKVVKLRDSGSIFFDATQRKGVSRGEVKVLKSTAQVLKAIKYKALVEIPEKDAEKELKKYLKEVEEAVVASSKNLKSLHESYTKKESKEKADKRIEAIKRNNKQLIDAINSDIALIKGDSTGEAVVIPEGEPTADWDRAEIMAWIDQEAAKHEADSKEAAELKYAKNTGIEKLLAKVEEYRKLVPVED